MFFENFGKVFPMTKLSNRNPCSPAVKPNGLYTLPSYMGNTNLFVSSCFLCTSVPSSLFLSLSLSGSSLLRLFTDRPSFLARLTLLPPLLVLPLSFSFSLDSFVCFPVFFLSLQDFRQIYLLCLCFRIFLSDRSGFRISQSFSSSYFLLVFHRQIVKFASKRFAACFSTSLAGISVSFRAHLIAVKLLPNKKETRWLTPTSTSFLQGQLMRVCKQKPQRTRILLQCSHQLQGLPLGFQSLQSPGCRNHQWVRCRRRRLTCVGLTLSTHW